MVAPASSDSKKFIVLDTLRSAGGTKGIISQRMSNGVITFSIVREFERDGVPDWTSYFSEAQLDDFESMLDLIKKRIIELRADPKIMPLRTMESRR